MVMVHCFFIEIYDKNNLGLLPKNDNDLQLKQKITFFGWLYRLTQYPWTEASGWRNTRDQPSVCRAIMLCSVINKALASSSFCLCLWHSLIQRQCNDHHEKLWLNETNILLQNKGVWVPNLTEDLIFSIGY